MNKRMVKAVKEQRREFVKKFGREPGPDDPLLFDPHQDTPQPLSGSTIIEYEKKIVEEMTKAGMQPGFVHAFKVTGRVMSEDGYNSLDKDDQLEWMNAFNEGQEIHDDDGTCDCNITSVKGVN